MFYPFVKDGIYDALRQVSSRERLQVDKCISLPHNMSIVAHFHFFFNPIMIDELVKSPI